MTEPTYTDLDQLNLPRRTYNALRRHRVHTIADLLRLGRRYFETPGRGIGHVGLTLIAHALREKGLQWADEGAPPLPELSSTAAQVVEALGLGDSAVIRRGLARVLRVSHGLDWFWEPAEPLFVAADLEHGTE
jgi:hypothetical protein